MIRNVLIKIILILLFLYLTLLGIRLSIYKGYNEDISRNVNIASMEINRASEENEVVTCEVNLGHNTTSAKTFGTLENLKFIVDVTVVDEVNNTYKGNTATDNGYSGIIEFQLSEAMQSNNSSSIEIGNTYVIETSPMMETSYNGFPLVTVIALEKATNDDIRETEKLKISISSFKRKYIEYNDMELKDIINDANSSYATWTQDEIREYVDFIKNKGYREGYKYKSYACTREQIKEVYSRQQNYQ